VCGRFNAFRSYIIVGAAVAAVDMETQQSVRVGVIELAEWLPTLADDAGFLQQLPRSGSLRGFSHFDFSTGEGPEIAAVLIAAPFE